MTLLLSSLLPLLYYSLSWKALVEVRAQQQEAGRVFDWEGGDGAGGGGGCRERQRLNQC